MQGTGERALNVVDIGRSVPPLTDIAGQLRMLADLIACGELKPEFAIVVLPPSDETGWPDIFSYGHVPGAIGMIGNLELAKAFFVNHMTERN